MPTDTADAIDELLPGDAAAAPALPALEVGGGANVTHVLLERVMQLQAGQAQQTDLIQKLTKSVLTSRSMINELVVTNNELKEELQKIKSAAQCDLCKKKESAFAVGTMFSVAGQTPDDEIDAIIEGRRRKEAWPVKHSTLNCFSVQQDLVKLRFHHSEKYQHVPIRIPKTEKNKDGTKPCKLCSEGKVRRKTTWMCAVCEVPLCTRPLMDEPGFTLTHHALWHSARDLITEHKKCYAALKDGRETRKRARTDVDVAEGAGGGVAHEEAMGGEMGV